MQALHRSNKTRIAGEWLLNAATQAVIVALSADGATPRFVGGCVRDALLGRPVKDIDIAIDRRPEQVVDLLEQAGLKAIPTGLSHGTVTAVVDRRPFEITSLREDTATDGRHAEVRFTSDWNRDASRRDFTMNALYADLDGTVHDFLGSGIADATAQRVRFIGSAADRIQEDYLRILRLFRFHAWYGVGEMEPDALVACAGLAGGIAGLSRERVGSEMIKLLSAPEPRDTLEAMSLTGVLAQALPAANAQLCIDALQELEKRFGFSPDPLRRLACLIWGQDLQPAIRSLRLSNQQAKELRARTQIGYEISESSAARRLGYERGEAPGRDVMLIRAAQTGTAPDVALLRAVAEGSRTRFPLRASDILALGIDPGPEVGEALKACEALWIESDFTLDKGSMIAEVRRLIHA